GRDREELLANLHALRAATSAVAGPPAGPGSVAGAGSTARPGSVPGPGSVAGPPPGVPLADCLGSYFPLAVPFAAPTPAATSSAALLDQLPEVTIAVRGRPLTELLLPAYLAFGEQGEAPGEPDGIRGE